MEIKTSHVFKKNMVEKAKFNKKSPKNEKASKGHKTESTSLVSQKFIEAIKASDVSNPGKVTEIKQSIKDGTYKVNYEKLADALLD
jgi:flagellar biosynthesis anti-sigma factor FlgM